MKNFRIERLPNGLLLAHDRACGWNLLFRRGTDGKWEPHCGQAGLPAYAALLARINLND